VIAIIPFAILFRSELKASLMAAGVQLTLFSNIYFGLALLAPGYSGDAPPVELDIGYANDLQMKGIYLLRFFLKDQFLLSSVEAKIHQDIQNRLEKQYKALGWTKKDLTLSIPTVQWGSITAEEFFTQYAQLGRPVIIKGFSSHAVKHWSAEYFKTKYGDYKIEVINISSIAPIRTTIGEFVDMSSKGEPLYLRSLSDIFDVHPELTDELGVRSFDNWMNSQYMTSQIFISNGRRGSGTSYHCANFNNLFFMIRGRKKWTFVDPNYTPLMYPMLNAKSMDAGSFVTTVALANETMMKEYFPLYELIPKQEAIVEPGDLLLNPPWNWHMIENLETQTVAVASRWFIPKGHTYQSSLLSTFQWHSKHIWELFYTRMYNRDRGIGGHKPTNTPPMDERINFGKPGSAINHVPRILPESYYATQGVNFFAPQED